MSVLIFRFSAMGDVAMTVPIVRACAVAHPEVSFTVVSRAFLQPLFAAMPSNVSFRGVDLKGYKGIGGLNALYKELRAEGYDVVADLHDVLRTKYIRWRFCLSGKRVAHIHKGRKEKKGLTRAKGKQLRPLKSSFERYADVFRSLGLKCDVGLPTLQSPTLRATKSYFTSDKVLLCPTVGIAPFAAHRGKEYGVERLTEVIRLLSQTPHIKIYIFGAGDEQKKVAEQWEQQFPETVVPMIGKLKLGGELEQISQLDVMLSMDSANMHLASLVGTPVVSIWGATHPYAGFLGWGQREEDVVQIDLPCRPCSIYGNKPCMRGDYACLNEIRPEQVVAHIHKYLNEKR